MLRLEADAPDSPPGLPDTDTDVSREAAELCTLGEPLPLAERSISVLRVRTGAFTLNLSVNTLRRTDRLVVTFTGARSAAKEAANSRWPMFERRGWDALFDAPILALSDPQTELDWDADLPRVGLYIGRFADDLVPELLALVDAVCDRLAVPRDRVVFYGACAGATAALLVASRREAATGVIAVGPWLRPDKFREPIVAQAARMAGGSVEDWERQGREQPWRQNPLVAVRDAIQAGRPLRVVVAQNLKERVTLHRHFPGLWRRFDIDPDGGVSPDGRVMAMLYESDDESQLHEPAALSRALVRQAYAFFDAPLVERPKKARKPRPAADAGPAP
jgi:hypothetical protein